MRRRPRLPYYAGQPRTWRRCPLHAVLACSRTFHGPSVGDCCKAPARQTVRSHRPRRTATDASTLPARRPGIRRSCPGEIPRRASTSWAPSTPPRPGVAKPRRQNEHKARHQLLIICCDRLWRRYLILLGVRPTVGQQQLMIYSLLKYLSGAKESPCEIPTDEES